MKAALVSTFLFCSTLLFGQIGSVEDGKYPTRTFAPQEYQAGNNVFCFVQDEQGILYSGNSKGISIYNGATWKLVELPNKSEVLWLSVDKEDNIFVAANDEFGYLKKKNGIHTYQSLATLLPDSVQGFGSIWEVESTSYGTYFRTSTYLFWYHEDQLDVLPMADYPGGRFDVIFSVNDTLLLRIRELGLGQMIGKSFELLPKGEFFKKIKTNAFLSLDDKVLVATRKDGLFLADENGVIEFENEIQQELKDARIYHATTYHNSIAIATLTKGVYILNKNGEMIEHIDEQKYNINESTNYVYLDTQDALWIGTLNGIMRIDFEDRFRVFDSIKGSNVVILDFLKYKDIFYFATSTGVFYSKTNDFKNAKKVIGINNPCYKISIIEDQIFVYANSGIFYINEKFEGIKQGEIHGFIDKTQVENCYFIAGQEGLTLATYNGDHFKVKKTLDVGKNIKSLYEFDRNQLWLCPANNGITYYNITTDSLSNFPQFGDSKVIEIEGKAIFVTSTGVFEYTQDQFIPSPFFYQYVDSAEYEVTKVITDISGNVMILYSDHALNLHGQWLKKLEAGDYQSYLLPDINLSTNDITASYLEENGILWFAANNRILRMDIPNSKTIDRSFSASFTGIFSKKNSIISNNKNPKLPYSQNSVRFEYAAIYYNSYGNNQYQYLMKGLDDDWSEWSEESSKEYSYLREGDYEFMIRSKNPNDVLSDPASYKFSILAPWYRSNLAFVSYFFGTVFLVILITRARSAQLKRENRELERVVADRTKEVASKNQKLEELDQLKSKFFANISHELRTPLTLINGQLEAIQKSRSSSDTDQRIENSKRNAAQLGNMIEDLLDLSKLELGQNMVALKPTEVNKNISRMVSSFQSLSESKNIELSYEDTLLEPVYTNLDIRQFEKVINNLLYNAFKFTQKNGDVGAKISANKDFIVMKVFDSGAGIESVELPHIFDRFYQAKNQISAEAGSGLGLAISKEIVDLHNGTIEAKSVIDSGTSFIITLPRIYGDFEELEAELEEQNISIENFMKEKIFKNSVDKPNILIVEDIEEMRLYLREILSANFNVSEAVNGAEALQWLKSNKVDLVISDVMMPVMTGLELLDELKKSIHLQHIPVVLLTARSSKEDRLEGLRFGVDDYITKPFDRDELLIRAGNLVANLHLRMTLAVELPDEPEEKEQLLSIDEEKMIRTAESYVESRISDSHLSVREVASSVAMSERQFYRKIGKLTGMTPAHFMMEIRLHYAHKLLVSGKMVKLSQVSSEIGISSPSYFSKIFFERFGKKPSKYLDR